MDDQKSENEMQQETKSKDTEYPPSETDQGVIKILRAEVDAIQTFIHEYRTGNQENSAIQWKMLLVTFITGLVVAVYTAVTFYQLLTTQEANRIARQSLAMSTRPWIGVDNPTIQVKSFELGGKPNASIVVRNFGKSPGFKVRMVTSMTLVSTDMREYVDGMISDLIKKVQDLGEIRPFPNASSSMFDMGTLWPEQKYVAQVECSTEITSERWNRISDGRMELMMVGQIIYYDDSLKIAHHTWIHIRQTLRTADGEYILTRPDNAPPDD